MSEKSEKIRAKSQKNLMKILSTLCNTVWSDRRRLITKKHFLPFRVFLNVGIDPNFPQICFFSFLALFREKFRFLAKTFLVEQRLAQSFTILGQSKVYELINKIERTNQSTRNALSEVENLTVTVRKRGYVTSSHA